MLYGLALLAGIVAGSRVLTAPAAVSWAAWLGHLDLGGSWLAFMGYAWTPWIFTALALSNSSPTSFPRRRAGSPDAVRRPHRQRRALRRDARRGGRFLDRRPRRRRGRRGDRHIRRRRGSGADGEGLRARSAGRVHRGRGARSSSASSSWRRRDDPPLRRDRHRRRPGRAADGRPARRGRARRSRVIERKLDRRHLRQHRLHADQDAGRQRLCRPSGAARRATSASAPDRSASISPPSWPARTQVVGNSRSHLDGWLRGMANCTLIEGHARFLSPTTRPGRRRRARGRAQSSSTSAAGPSRPTFRASIR